MDNVKDKITKLLAMATHERSNEHEAETAMRMAEKLMREHNIEISDLEASTGKQTVYNWTSRVIPLGEKAKPMAWRPMWAGYLITAVGKFTDCKAGYVNDSNYGCCVKFSGDEVDIEYAAWLFKKLRDFGYSESYAVAGKSRDTFRKSYAIRLQGRMRDLRAERDAALKQAVTKTGNALVVVQNKLALRDAEFGGQRYGKARKVRLASAGFHEGRAAADRANFNRPISGGSQQLLS